MSLSNESLKSLQVRVLRAQKRAKFARFFVAFLYLVLLCAIGVSQCFAETNAPIHSRFTPNGVADDSVRVLPPEAGKNPAEDEDVTIPEPELDRVESKRMDPQGVADDSVRVLPPEETPAWASQWIRTFNPDGI